MNSTPGESTRAGLETLPDVLRLGDERLRVVSVDVEDPGRGEFVHSADQLKAVLQAFRASHGFGRAIAAPQIGLQQRFIALNLGHGPFVIVNPVITWRSDERVTLWDDCMSFPDLMVRLHRAASISITFQDEQNQTQHWHNLATDLSELLQHEIDHLDGVLAVDRAIDNNAIITRQAFSANRAAYEASVDYAIQATGD